MNKIKFLIVVFLLSTPFAVHAMSDKDYARYRKENARQIEAADRFNKNQILRMQRRHDKMIDRYHKSIIHNKNKKSRRRK